MLRYSVAKIFISHRRGDCGAFAFIVINRLREHYGADAVLSRRGRALPGEDIREHTVRFIRQLDVVVAMVGPAWVGRSREGRTRLSDESDRIRLEIESTLAHRVVILPVRIGDCPILAAELPESMKDFSRIEPLRLATEQAGDSQPTARPPRCADRSGGNWNASNQFAQLIGAK